MLFQENKHPIPRTQHTTIAVNLPCNFTVSYIYISSKLIQRFTISQDYKETGTSSLVGVSFSWSVDVGNGIAPTSASIDQYVYNLFRRNSLKDKFFR